MPWISCLIPGPQPASLPPGIRVVDSTSHISCEEPQWIRNAKNNPLVNVWNECEQRIRPSPCSNRNIGSQSQSIELIDPATIEKVCTATVGDILHLRSWNVIERPPFHAMLRVERFRTCQGL